MQENHFKAKRKTFIIARGKMIKVHECFASFKIHRKEISLPTLHTPLLSMTRLYVHMNIFSNGKNYKRSEIFPCLILLSTNNGMECYCFLFFSANNVTRQSIKKYSSIKKNIDSACQFPSS